MKESSSSKKIIAIISMILSIAVIVLAVLQVLNIWTKSIVFLIPLLCIENMCQAVLLWDKNRKTAYICLGCSVIIILCLMAVILLG